MMDFITDPQYDVVAFKTSARVGKTRILDTAIGYYLEYYPSPVLMFQPTEADAADYVESEINPMIRDTPVLRDIVKRSSGGARAGQSEKQKWHTKFTSKGSNLRVRWAASEDNFRRLTTRINCGDEVDAAAWDPSKGGSDKIDLLKRRGQTFWDAKTILTSTPKHTAENGGRIDGWYQAGTQHRYFVPCPHCHEKQTLEFGSPSTAHGLKWPDGKPEQAFYVCKSGCVIEESDKRWMIDNGEWRQTNPNATPGVCSAHIWAAYSPFPNASWGKIAAEFVSAKRAGPAKLMSFINEVLGEAWNDAQNSKVSQGDLARSVEVYAAEVPDWVRVLTMGADVQFKDDGRFEIEVAGWGRGETKATIGYWILDEHPLNSPEAWQALDALINRKFRKADGTELAVAAAAIDSGGRHTMDVYEFCNRRARRRVWAIKGSNTTRGEHKTVVWPEKPSKGKNNKTFYRIETQLAKFTIAERLSIPANQLGSWHWPANAPSGSVEFDDTYFTRFLREKVKETWRNGRRIRYWDDNVSDQEPWDCAVYSYAALQGLKRAHRSWRSLLDNGPDPFEGEGPAPAAPSASLGAQAENVQSETPSSDGGARVPRRRRRKKIVVGR